MDGRLTLVGWFIVAGVCLSPILIFSIASVIGRWFLQRRLWQHVQRRASVVADRSGDGVDAPRRHLRAKVTASNRH